MQTANGPRAIAAIAAHLCAAHRRYLLVLGVPFAALWIARESGSENNSGTPD